MCMKISDNIGKTDILKDLYNKYIDTILEAGAGYKKHLEKYSECRAEFEKTLNEEQKKELENVCDAIFDLETALHEQVFKKRLSELYQDL